MSLPEYVLSQIKCCLSQDQHILEEPVLLKCGGNACKECIQNYRFECQKCSMKHNKNDFVECKSTRDRYSPSCQAIPLMNGNAIFQNTIGMRLGLF